LFNDASEAKHELRMLRLLRDLPRIVKPSVPSLLPVGHRACLVMPEVPQVVGPRDISTICRDASMLCQTVSSMHDKGIFHLDLKPDNVLVTENGPVVIDFGHAREIKAGDTLWLSRFGTVGYCISSPIRSADDAASADRFGVGVTILCWLGLNELPLASDGILRSVVASSASRSSPMASELVERGFNVPWRDDTRLPKILRIVSNIFTGSLSLSAASQRLLQCLPKRSKKLRIAVEPDLGPVGQENQGPSKPLKSPWVKPLKPSPSPLKPSPSPLASRNPNIIR